MKGKSTLRGKEWRSNPPARPLKRVRCIDQEFNLVKDIDIARNMFLGMEPMLAFGMVDERKL